jgi:hypothetical protein
MRTKIILVLGAVALITLSFTFSTNPATANNSHEITTVQPAHEVIGFISDEVVK